MQALAKYKQIHMSNPLNVECLRYLVHICGELGELDTMSCLTACWLCLLPIIAVAFPTHVCVFNGLLVTWAASSSLGCLACRCLRQLPTDKQACRVVKDQHKVSCLCALQVSKLRKQTLLLACEKQSGNKQLPG